MATGDRTAQTYRYECYRSVASGILETANTTFLLIIAVRWFQAGALAKGCVAAGLGVGYLATPLVVALVESARMPVARAAGYLAAGGGLAILVAAFLPWESVFVVTTILAMAATGAIIPLVTQIYQDNYPDSSRGSFFARTFMIRIVSAAAFSFGGGALLSADIGHFQLMLAFFAAALGFSAWCLWRIPSAPLHLSEGGHPFRALRFVRDDRMFRTTLISWMLMGFANLMMLPLRVEYLANPRYHLQLAPDVIALLTGIVPNISRLVLSPVWGWLFDRANFFVVRICLNVGFALGITSFFMSDSMTGLVLSAIVYGLSVAGGDVAWGLWVTKIAPPERVADYMSVHTFFTGVRAMIAPIIGFAVVARWSIAATGWLSALMILGATVLLLPEIKHGGLVRKVVAPAQPPMGADD
ncbi:MAG: MFS transporter [Vicinamibacterales bacterium]